MSAEFIDTHAVPYYPIVFFMNDIFDEFWYYISPVMRKLYQNNCTKFICRDTNSLVEEFMLLANISVAKKLYEHFPQHAVLRKHPEPSPSMFESLLKSVESHVRNSFYDHVIIFMAYSYVFYFSCMVK